MASPIAINAEPAVWNDATTFTGLTNAYSGTHLAECWVYRSTCGAAHTVERVSDVPATSQGAAKARYALRLTTTTADASLAAGDACWLEYRIEGTRALPIVHRPFTVGFWCKASKGGTHYLSARNSGSDRSCVVAYTIDTNFLWQWVNVTFPATADEAGTWDYTTNVGLALQFTLAAGSSYLASGVGSWQASNYLGVAGLANEIDTVGNIFAVHGLTVVPGHVARPFAPRPLADELRDTARYCEVLGGAEFQTLGTGEWISATQLDVHVPLQVTKRAAPTLSVATVGNLAATADGSFLALTALANVSPTALRDLLVRGTVASGGTAGKAGKLLVGAGNVETVKALARLGTA